MFLIFFAFSYLVLKYYISSIQELFLQILSFTSMATVYIISLIAAVCQCRTIFQPSCGLSFVVFLQSTTLSQSLAHSIDDAIIHSSQQLRNLFPSFSFVCQSDRFIPPVHHISHCTRSVRPLCVAVASVQIILIYYCMAS